MNRPEYWVLDENGEAVPGTILEWAEMLKTRAHIVARDEPTADIMVSTVMLGIDHSFRRGGPPLLYETMIFGSHHDGYQERYSTRADAEAGHAIALELSTEVKK